MSTGIDDPTKLDEQTADAPAPASGLAEEPAAEGIDQAQIAEPADPSPGTLASGEHPPFDQPEELDEETRQRRDAALRQVRKLGDPVLRASAVAVERFDERLRGEVERMGQLMQDALGVGLAATQVGVLHRVLVYKAYEDDPLGALVNPVMEWESEEREAKEEGCLSLPGVHVEVERAVRVRVRAQDTHGKELLVEEEGLPARVIQHEMDHLEGVLILDRISREARLSAMRALREAREADEGIRPTRVDDEVVHVDRSTADRSTAPA